MIEPELPGPKPVVGAGTFFAVDLRVGRVVHVEGFPEAHRPAWKLFVDFGPAVGVLGTSAQVADYPREELLRRLVVGAINLGHKRIAGFTSQFLLLAAVRADGSPRLLEVPDDVEPGSPVA